MVHSTPSDQQLVHIQKSIDDALRKKTITLESLSSILKDAVSKVKELLMQKENLEKQISEKEKQLSDKEMQLQSRRQGTMEIQALETTVSSLKQEISDLKQQLLQMDQEPTTPGHGVQHSELLEKLTKKSDLPTHGEYFYQQCIKILLYVP